MRLMHRKKESSRQLKRHPLHRLPSDRSGMARVTRSPPASIKPELAAWVKAAPEGTDWLHEMKLDGYRMHARLDAGRVNILTRRGNDWTEKYPAIAQAIGGLPRRKRLLLRG